MNQKTPVYYPIDTSGCAASFAQSLQAMMEGRCRCRPVVILCIGTDRVTGDCLGPLVGQFLVRNLPREKAMVYGTLCRPVHAENLTDTLSHIHHRYQNAFIIAVDASLGMSSHIRHVTLEKGKLRPGLGVQHALPAVGDLHITGIVNASTADNHRVLATTRLSVVMEEASFIARGILNALD